MASLRKMVSFCRDELPCGIAWVVFWRQGRCWYADYIYLDIDASGIHRLLPEDANQLEEIRCLDPKAVVLNSYYCGYLAEDVTVDELSAGVRRHYDNGYSNIADFIAAHIIQSTQTPAPHGVGSAHMTELQVFNSAEFGSVRVIQEDDTLLFCGADVAKALGYSNPNKAINDHCRVITKRDTPISGKMQAVNFHPRRGRVPAYRPQQACVC